MTSVTAGPDARAVDDGAPPVLLSREGDVVTLTLNHPRRKNVSHPAWLLLRDSLAAVAGSDVRVLVVTGAAGDFNAGADLSVEREVRPPMARPEPAAPMTAGQGTGALPGLERDGQAGQAAAMGRRRLRLLGVEPGLPLRHRLGEGAAMAGRTG